jgi:hypothetical protein
MATNFGLNNTLEYTEFQLDSFDTTLAYNQSYYTTDWPVFAVGKPLDNVAAIKVLEVQIPFTYYVFNSTNNTFTLTEGAGSPQKVTITPGNYTSSSMFGSSTANSGVLAAALHAASQNGFNYTCIYNSATQVFVTTVSSGDFTLTFGTNLNDPGQSNPRLWLGFSGGANTSSSSTLTSPSVIQLTGPNYIYICSRVIGGQIKLYLSGDGQINPGNTGADGPQIARIPITSQPGGVTFWQDPVPLMWFDTGNSALNQNFDIYCTLGTATDSAPLQFNGASFTVKLGVLTNTHSHSDMLGGGAQNNNVLTRTWPTGASRGY